MNDSQIKDDMKKSQSSTFYDKIQDKHSLKEPMIQQNVELQPVKHHQNLQIDTQPKPKPIFQYSSYILQFYDFLFEYEHFQISGIAFLGIGLILLNFIQILIDLTQYSLHSIQTIYIMIWTSFLINFLILYRSGDPIYISSQIWTSSLHRLSYNFTFMIITFLYAYSFGMKSLVIFIFFFAWFFALITNNIKKQENFPSWCFLSTIGTAIGLYDAFEWSWIAFVFAFLSSISLFMLFEQITTFQQINQFSVQNYLFAYPVFFLPAFFTIQEMIVPTVYELILAIFFGLLFHITISFVIRGIQQEETYIGLTYLQQILVIDHLWSLISGQLRPLHCYIGAFITGYSLFCISFKINKINKENVRESEKYFKDKLEKQFMQNQ